MFRLALIVAVLTAAPVAAHDYWLLPDTFTPKAGKGVVLNVRLHVGEAFKSDQEIAYAVKPLAKLELLTSQGRAAADTITAPNAGDKPAHPVPLEHAGTSVLRIDRNWSAITLKADKFTAYLKEEGLDHVIAAREKAGEAGADGKERYRRCLKTIVQAGDAPGSEATHRFGQTLEIIPAKNPYSLKAGDELPIMLEFDAKPLAGVKVTAWHRAAKDLTAVTATTDKDGKVSLKLPKSGTWIVRTVYMRKAAADKLAPDADWESFWASVTFAVP